MSFTQIRDLGVDVADAGICLLAGDVGIHSQQYLQRANFRDLDRSAMR